MRKALLVGLLAGCGFGTGMRAGGDPGDPGSGSGNGGGSGSGGGVDTTGCDVQDASLRLCLSFRRPPMVVDLLAPPHQPSVAMGLGSIIVGTLPIAKFDAGSRLLFADDPDFDMSSLTIEMSIDPDHSVQHGSYTIVDNQQYAVSYEQDQHVQCKVGMQAVRSSGGIGGGQHHVACRYDASRQDLRIYVDGNVVGCATGPTAIPGDSAGLAIGASYDGTRYQNNYVGTIDSLHLYASAIAESQICAAPGQPSCTKCPDGDGKGGGR